MGVIVGSVHQHQVRVVAAKFHAPATVCRRLEESCEDGTLHSPPVEFASGVPYRPFEKSWAQAGGVTAAGFRTAHQISVLPATAAHLVRAFGLRASSLASLFARAAFSAVTRRG